MEKSANKLWRESGTTLSFKDWINRENQKKEDTTQNFVSFEGEPSEQLVSDTINYTISGGDVQNRVGKTGTILGLNRGVLIFSGILIAGSLGFYFYSRLKKRQ
jgi:hypothetical protein